MTITTLRRIITTLLDKYKVTAWIPEIIFDFLHEIDVFYKI